MKKQEQGQERKIGKQNEENNSIISGSNDFGRERWDGGFSGSGSKCMRASEYCEYNRW